MCRQALAARLAVAWCHCFYLAFLSLHPFHPNASHLHPAKTCRPGTKKTREAASPDTAPRPDFFRAQCRAANASTAAPTPENRRWPIIPCAFPSPSTIIIATNQRPSNRPKMRTRSSSAPSSSTPRYVPIQRSSIRASQWNSTSSASRNRCASAAPAPRPNSLFEPRNQGRHHAIGRGRDGLNLCHDLSPLAVLTIEDAASTTGGAAAVRAAGVKRRRREADAGGNRFALAKLGGTRGP
jgi:hypothetical protein